MKLLVGVDLKKDARFVVEAALPWAIRLGCKVDLLYIDPFRTYGADGDDPTLSVEYLRLEADDTRYLRELLEHLPETHRGRPLIAEGDPATVLVERGASYDLVLVATSGRSGLLAFVLGSVAERVVRSCPRPVLVLRYAA